MAIKIKVVRNKYGALNGYIGSEWHDSFGENQAIDWLASMLESSPDYVISDKSVYGEKDIAARKAEKAAMDARHSA